MARGARMKIVRNPVHPRQSVISGRTGAGKNGLDLIDIGAAPINRYGVVYITTHEAIDVAELIGWVDGEVVREKFDALEAENRELRAAIAALPLLINEISEKYKDGLDTLARDLTAGFDAHLAALPVADPAERPTWASAERAAVELGDSGRSENLSLIDDGGDDPAGEAVGGQPLGDGGADERGEGVPAAAADLGAGDDGDGSGEREPDLAAGDPAGSPAAAVDAKPFRITDIDAGDDDQASGDA